MGIKVMEDGRVEQGYLKQGVRGVTRCREPVAWDPGVWGCLVDISLQLVGGAGEGEGKGCFRG